MDWLHAIDVALFRFINHTLSNAVFDRVMPQFSSNPAFIPAVVVLALAVIWRGTPRSRMCAVLVVLAVTLGDSLVCNTLKQWIARPRPFLDLADAIVHGGQGGSGSMPSSHAANWFAAATVMALFYRRSGWALFPAAALVGFSRIYNGMHYPGDVLAGALLGAGYALGGVLGADYLWRVLGQKWFPLWLEKYPSLLHLPCVAERRAAGDTHPPPGNGEGRQWVRFGFLVIGTLLVVRLGYIASDTIELGEDEAYQWLWSQHPALSYYSKPPLIAWTQWLGTALFGDNVFGVRFFSPVISAAISLLILCFLAREANPRAAFWCVMTLTAAPMMAAGSVLMTIDPLNCLFWTAAMITGWRALQTGSTKLWLLAGLCTGLSFLAKYTALFQLLCWAVFFVLWPAARAQLRRPGPWLALLVVALCSLPVLAWNAQHGWITITHLSERGGLAQEWKFQPKFIWDFLGAELALLNPVFAVAAVWAAVAVWRKHRDHPLAMFLLSMSAPLILFYAAWTLRARVQPNWIAPAIPPLFMLMAWYWDGRWRDGLNSLREWLRGTLILSLFVCVLLHDTNLISKILGQPLPVRADPLRRVRGWQALADVVGVARHRLAREGKPVFIIAAHYGLAGQLSFYLPEAKEGVPHEPLVYYQSSDKPENQFYFWPGYQGRRGENAIYVLETTDPQPPPERLLREFESVRTIALPDIEYRGRTMRTVQLFECRNLR
jgi:4-amino-4-deoxy-L-arabinose transferase-like glycosyltransferase/membrane-associated phospholipid phosphatase